MSDEGYKSELGNFSITPGKHYRFTAWRRAENVATPRRSVIACVLWRDDADKPVKQIDDVVRNYSIGRPTAEPEYPRDISESPAANGWTELSGVYQAPPGATRALIQLHLLWAPKGKVEWSDISLVPTESLPSRKVRIASVHFKPRGAKTSIDACRQFAPLIEQAAQQKADLVVLGETLTYAGVGSNYADCAEPIPGPSTDYFGDLARKHNLHIVAGLIERDGHELFNVAALIAP